MHSNNESQKKNLDQRRGNSAKGTPLRPAVSVIQLTSGVLVSFVLLSILSAISAKVLGVNIEEMIFWPCMYLLIVYLAQRTTNHIYNSFQYWILTLILACGFVCMNIGIDVILGIFSSLVFTVIGSFAGGISIAGYLVSVFLVAAVTLVPKAFTFFFFLWWSGSFSFDGSERYKVVLKTIVFVLIVAVVSGALSLLYAILSRSSVSLLVTQLAECAAIWLPTLICFACLFKICAPSLKRGSGLWFLRIKEFSSTTVFIAIAGACLGLLIVAVVPAARPVNVADTLIQIVELTQGALEDSSYLIQQSQSYDQTVLLVGQNLTGMVLSCIAEVIALLVFGVIALLIIARKSPSCSLRAGKSLVILSVSAMLGMLLCESVGVVAFQLGIAPSVSVWTDTAYCLPVFITVPLALMLQVVVASYLIEGNADDAADTV